jgi:beta-phosphoglucomutase-like phosphatase (HAD superfamily)
VKLNGRAILFDMDGTLVNSDGAVRRIWTTFAEPPTIHLS